MNIQTKQFDQLSTHELYQLLKLRFDVFIVEQTSIFDEFDEKDYTATHICFRENKELLAYARIYAMSNTKINLGRIVIHPNSRSKGFGKQLIEHALAYIKESYPKSIVDISAQYHLKQYYESFGFRQTSEIYDDGGIDHINMEYDNSLKHNDIENQK